MEKGEFFVTFCVMSGWSLRLVLAVMGCVLFSAEESGKSSGVQIVHYPPGGKDPFYAIFMDDEEVVYQDASGPKTQNLCAALKECMLAGYRLYADIGEKAISDDRIFQTGVRELVSYSEPFYLGELRSLFTGIATLVDRGCQVLKYPGRGQKMGPGYIAKWIYPKGFTRVWTMVGVGQMKKPVKYDRVSIICKGEEFALDGRLQKCGDTEDGGPPEGSLLLLKRRLDRHAPKVEVPPSPTEQFLNNVNPTGRAGCILWRRKESQHPGVLFLSDKNMCMYPRGVHFTFRHPELPDTFTIPISVRDFWQKSGIWFGYVFKHPAPRFVDFAVVGSGPIRGVVCYTQDFVSEELQESFVHTLEDFAETVGKESKKGAQDIWDEAQYLSPQNQKLLWTVIEDEIFLQKFLAATRAADEATLEEMLPQGGVLCIMREDQACLRGIPVPTGYAEKPKESLREAWVKRVLTEKKDVGAFKIVAQKERVGVTGVQIVHYPVLGWCPSYVAFNKEQEVVVYQDSSRQETRNLYKELQEFILAGYHLHAGISVKAVCNEGFFQAGVRELISHSEPFDSGELRSLFTKIAKLVDAGEGLTLDNPGRWEKMEPGYISEWIYPTKGLWTRQWRVIDEGRLRKVAVGHDRVCIAFSGERVVLEGRLQKRETIGGRPSERSLLFIKRNRLSEKPPRPLAERKTSAVEMFFLTQENVGADACRTAMLIYKGDGKLAAFCAKRLNRSIECHDSDGCLCPVNTTMRQVLKCLLLEGFVLKHPPVCGYVDVDALSTPQMRNVACDKRAFTSSLQKVLCAYEQFLGSSCVEHAQSLDVITREDVRSLDPKRQKLLWTIVEDERFINHLVRKEQLENIKQGTVFCLIRGESAILQGVPVSQNYKAQTTGETLLKHWNKNIVLAHKNRGL